MNKVVEYLKNNEKTTKIVTSTILFFAGLGVLFLGLSFASVHGGFCITLSFLGIVAIFLGIIPLIYFWIDWHNIN